MIPKWSVALLIPLVFYQIPIMLFLTILLYISFSVFLLGIVLTIWAHLSLSSPHQIPIHLLDSIIKDLKLFHVNIVTKSGEVTEKTESYSPNHLPVVFGRTVDSQIQQIIDLILRDFLLIYLKDHTHQIHTVLDSFKSDLWGAVQLVHERLNRVDVDKLLACDLVLKITAHLEKIREAKASIEELNEASVFNIYPHLKSQESELNHLRQMSEFFITTLLPRQYLHPPVYFFLREVLTCKVLQPAIDLLTDPDYINSKIIDYMKAQSEAAAMQTKTFEYAKTFEDYIRLIENCKDMELLKKFRYDIMSQIMQATTLENMKRARGIDIDEIERGNVGTHITREQVNAAKRLKRYINQLTFAKNECEIALKSLGWEGAFPLQDSDSSKVISLQLVLESDSGRKHLSRFMESLYCHGLVGFWTSVEELKCSPQSSWHQLGADIFYNFVRSPSAQVKVDKETRKKMEAFLLGDKGPEVFFDVQQQVYNIIQEKYYPSFCLSDHYTAFHRDLALEETTRDTVEEISNCGDMEAPLKTSSAADCFFGGMEQSTYARRKLQQLQEKHSNKTQALAALRASLKPDSKALKVVAAEADRLAAERRRLEVHLARTDTWARHLGSWRAQVHSADVSDAAAPPHFVIVVHMEEIAEKAEGVATGWVILRTLREFQELHRKLLPLCAELKNLELPSNTFKFLFGKNDKNSLDKAKNLIQKYLDFILENDRLNQSEALYSFLNPSSEHLKHSNSLPKKAKFSFSTLFKSNSDTSRSSHERGSTRESTDEDEISLYLDGESGETMSKNMNRGVLGVQLGLDDRDTIAEPIYGLLSEIFDMRGVFKWLRRTLITFVQITYGRTINRQIRDTISWMFSEQMLHFYLNVVLKSWWPGGELCFGSSDRKTEDCEARKKQAETLLLSNVSEVLCNIVGNHTARCGAFKIFHTLQLKIHNKQLAYEIIDLFIIELFPEIKKYI